MVKQSRKDRSRKEANPNAVSKSHDSSTQSPSVRAALDPADHGITILDSVAGMCTPLETDQQEPTLLNFYPARKEDPSGEETWDFFVRLPSGKFKAPTLQALRKALTGGFKGRVAVGVPADNRITASCVGNPRVCYWPDRFYDSQKRESHARQLRNRRKNATPTPKRAKPVVPVAPATYHPLDTLAEHDLTSDEAREMAAALAKPGPCEAGRTREPYRGGSVVDRARSVADALTRALECSDAGEPETKPEVADSKAAKRQRKAARKERRKAVKAQNGSVKSQSRDKPQKGLLATAFQRAAPQRAAPHTQSLGRWLWDMAPPTATEALLPPPDNMDDLDDALGAVISRECAETALRDQPDAGAAHALFVWIRAQLANDPSSS